jgi:hypothetical protein
MPWGASRSGANVRREAGADPGGGAFVYDPPPEADGVPMRTIPRDENLEQEQHRIRSISASLPPGSALVALAARTDDARAGNTSACFCR